LGNSSPIYICSHSDREGQTGSVDGKHYGRAVVI
jgi:hypothetical protein